MKSKTLIALAVMSAVGAAHATTLDFEGTTSFFSIADYYNGGTDGAGASGTNYGVSFTGGALALQNDALGPYFSHAPGPGDTVMFAGDSSALMNVAGGFVSQLQFSYSAANGGLDLVNIYSGLNGTRHAAGQREPVRQRAGRLQRHGLLPLRP